MKLAIKNILLLLIAFVIITNLKGQNKNQQLNASFIRKKIEPFFTPPPNFKNKYGEYRPSLNFYDGQVAKTPEDWKKRREQILNRWHEMMGVWPPLIKHQEIEIIDTIRKDSFTQYRIKFYWLPGEKTEGYLLIPDRQGEKPAVITVYYEPETAVGLGKTNATDRDFAYQLAKRGFVTLSI